MDFGLDGVNQGYSVLEQTAQPYEDVEKALLPKREVLESISFAGKHGYPTRQLNVVGRKGNKLYTPQRRVQDTEGAMDRVIPGQLTRRGKQAAGVVGGGALVGAGGGATYLAHDRKKVSKAFGSRAREAYRSGTEAVENANKITQNVESATGKVNRLIPDQRTGLLVAGGGLGALGGSTYGATYLGTKHGYMAGKRKDRKRKARAAVSKREIDPEGARQKRLEAYQTGLTAGGLGAGAAGLGAYGAQTGRHVGRLKNIAERRGKRDQSPGRLRELPIRVVGAGLKPSKGQAAATLGGLGAVLAGDQIGRYRRDRGQPYNPLR